MPIVATPSTPLRISRDDVRRFMRDFPDKNILLDTVEFSQEDVDQALRYVLSTYNTMAPLTNLTLESFPASQEILLLLGAAWYLVRSEAFSQLRNQFTYQAGDIMPVGVHDKHSLYLNFSNTLKADWENLAQRAKIQMNLEAGYGFVSSSYLFTTRYTYT